MQIKVIKKSILLIAISSVGLSGCGGGGGGSSSNVKPVDDYVEVIVPETPTEANVPAGFVKHVDAGDDYNLTENAEQAGFDIWRENGYTGSGVNVAIIDGGLKPGSEEDMNVVFQANALLAEEGEEPETFLYVDGDDHGDEMARIIGSYDAGVAPDVNIMSVVVSDGSPFIDSFDTMNGIKIAEENGAEVLNVSISPGFADKFFQENPDDPLEDGSYEKEYLNMLSRFNDKGLVVVKSAGNNVQNVSELVTETEGDFYLGWVQTELKDNVVYVGASYGNDEGLADFSGFAGESVDVQDRFLMAPALSTFEEGYSSSGTSGAAATVSGGLALMLERWSHLTPSQAAQIALDTANKDFEGYSASLHGQGHFDMASAWSPQGKTAIPFDDGQVSVQASLMTLPAGFAEKEIRTAIVDEYQRDYMVSVPVKTQKSSLKSRLSSISMGKAVTKPVTQTIETGLTSTIDMASIDNVNREEDGLTYLGLGNAFDAENALTGSGTIALERALGNSKVEVALVTPNGYTNNSGMMAKIKSKGFTVGAYASGRKNDTVFYGAEQQLTKGALVEYKTKGITLGLESSARENTGNSMISSYKLDSNKAYLGFSSEIAKGLKLGVIGYAEDYDANIDVTTPISNGDGTIRVVEQKINSESLNKGVSFSAQIGSFQASVTQDQIDSLFFIGFKKQFK